MEFDYYLNSDCIQNFELAHYHIYLQIVLTTKTLFSRFPCTSKLDLSDIEHVNYLCIDKFIIFRNLTYINFFKTITYNDFTLYIESYFKKYCQYPVFQTLNGLCDSNVLHFRKLTNLRNFQQRNTSICSAYLNEYSGLTSLTFLIPFYETLEYYTSLGNLKVLYIKKHHHVPVFVNYNDFIHLEKLTIEFSWPKTSKAMNIAYLNLTYLSIQNESETNLCIHLNPSMKLKYLRCDNINILDLNNYLKKNIKYTHSSNKTCFKM